jgi:hypothetical protein
LDRFAQFALWISPVMFWMDIYSAPASRCAALRGMTVWTPHSHHCIAGFLANDS